MPAVLLVAVWARPSMQLAEEGFGHRPATWCRNFLREEFAQEWLAGFHQKSGAHRGLPW